MKIIKPILLLLAILTIFNSCDKYGIDLDPTKPACETNKYGTITISNSSSNPYDIYIDGTFNMRLSGGTISSKKTIYEGNNRKMYAVQVSGYIFYPTEKTTYFNVISCSDYSWQIP